MTIFRDLIIKGRSCLLFLFFVFILRITAYSQEPLQPYKTDTPPVIDAVLDDAVWENAPMVTGFKSFVPDYGKDMGFKTEVFLAYDMDNMYFAFIAYDEPGMIKTSVAARDRIRDNDWVAINLDPFGDHQTISAFYVNPSGIQMDTRLTGGGFGGGGADLGIDMVWYSAGRITEYGYIVEVRIPYKSIRYRNGDIVHMGVVFERKISRLSMQGSFPALDPQMGRNFLLQTHPLDYREIRKLTLLEVLPSVTYENGASHEEGELRTVINRAEVGLSAKYGITSDLILDATINPDFSQVESDVGRIDFNQRFPVFYPERRPFFLEGNEYYNFAETGGRDAIRSVINTRTIVNPIVAGKLTGRIGTRNTIASIFALDELRSEDVNGGDRMAQVGVFRYKRAFTGDSYLGAVYTSRELNGYFNRVVGTDGRIRLTKSSTIQAHYLYSFDMDTVGSPVNNGHSLKVGYNRNTRNIFIGVNIHDITDFKSKVGFVTRTENTRFNTFVSPRIFFDTKVLQRIDPAVSITYLYDKPSGLFEYSYWVNVRFRLIRNSQITFNYNLKNEIFLEQDFNRSNFRASVESQITKRVFFDVSYRLGNKILYDDIAPYQGYGRDISGKLNLQVTDNFNSEWRYSYSDFYETSTEQKDYDVSIIRSKNTYQVNKYLFFRLIIEYKSLHEQLITNNINTNFLISFTYIPGTVVHLGYGNVYDNTHWNSVEYVYDKGLLQTQRGLFFKASYLFRK